MIMETKIIDLREIRKQLIANIYNLLKEKGYEPEEGINIVKGLYGDDEDEQEDAPQLLVTASNSLNYVDEIMAYPFAIGYITFFQGTEFEVCEGDPEEDESVNYVTDEDFPIESLSALYSILEDIRENNNNSKEE